MKVFYIRNSFAVLATLLSFTILAQSEQSPAHSNETLLKAFISTLNRHDAVAFADLFSDSCRYEEMNSGRTYTSREGIAAYIRATLQGIPDSKFEILRLMANEKLGMIEWVWTGTNSVGYPQMGIPATGKYMELTGVSILEFRNGKIHRNRDYWDTDSFMKEIGAR